MLAAGRRGLPASLVAIGASLGLVSGFLAGGSSALANPAETLSPMATSVASVSPVRSPGANGLSDLPAAFVTFSGAGVRSFGPNTALTVELVSAPSGSAELHLMDSTGSTDDSVVSLVAPSVAASVARTLDSSGDDSILRIKADTAGTYAARIANGSDTVNFSFTTTGLPVSLVLAPSTQTVTVGQPATIAVELRDASGNLTQPLNVDSVSLSESGGATLSTSSLAVSDLARGTASVNATLASPGTATLTATPAGTLLAAGVSSSSATITSAPDTTLNATGVAKWGGDDSVPINGLPGAPLAGVTVSKVDAGTYSACALGANGRVYCWGAGSSGQLGVGSNGSSQTPLAVSTSGALAGKTIVDIAVGDAFACAVDSAGKGYCWGSTSRLGAGSSVANNTVPNPLEPFSAIAGKTLVSVTAGLGHACALDDAGAAYCWGENGSGQLGDGSTISRTVPVAAAAPGDGSTWTQLSANGSHTCGVTTSGDLWCWGANSNGQLGDGSTTSRLTPVSVGDAPDGSAWDSVSAGSAHTCAVTSGGEVYCWGWNLYGQLGNGTAGWSTDVTAPTGTTQAPADASGWEIVEAGSMHTCAVSTDGQVSCWGRNSSGQLGDGTAINRATPVVTTGPPGVEFAFIAGGTDNSCAVSTTGVTYCWGAVSHGALGSSSQPTNALSPIAVDRSSPLDGAQIDDIAAGPNHRCVLVEGAAYCWGWGTSGQLGNGVNFDSASPVAVRTDGVLAGKTLVEIDAGWSHTCAADTLGDVFCWGAGGRGELGNGSTVDSASPVAVTKAAGALLNEKVIQLSLEGSTSCAVTESGGAVCWGSGQGGQLGNGSTQSRQVPVPVDLSWMSNDDSVALVTGVAPPQSYWQADYSSFCLLTHRGSVRCWGTYATYDLEPEYYGYVLASPTTISLGGLGPGSRLVDLVAANDPDSIAPRTLCGLDQRGVIYCKGNGSRGQLGSGSTNSSWQWSPVTGGDIGGRESVALGTAASSFCAVDAVGRTYCWGYNAMGQIGDGSKVNRLSPVRVNYSGPLSGRPVVQIDGGGSRYWVLTSDGPLVSEAPSQPSVTAASASLAVTWTAPGDTGGQAATGYRLRYSDDGGSSWTVVSPDSGSADRAATIGSLTNGRSYIVQVAAITSAGLGAWSASSTPATPRTLPGAPSGLQASSGDGRVDLTWNSPDDTGGAAITTYAVLVTPGGGASVAVSGTTAAVTGLTNGQSYSFTVAAINVAGAGPASGSASATPEPGPGTPTLVQATPGNAQVDLTWTAPDAVAGVTITGYAIQRSSDGGITWTTVTADTGSTSRTYTSSGLGNGTTYWFRVAARAGTRQGLWSSLSNSATPRTVPGASPSVTATPGDRRLSVTWTRPSDGGAAISGYRIEYSSDNAGSWTTAVANTGNSALNYVITGLVNNTAYLVRVAAINVAGTGDFATIGSAVTPVPDTPIDYREDTSLAAPSQICPAAGNRIITLAWNAASGAQGYVVEYRAQGGAWSQLRVALPALQATIDGLANGTRYEFRVAATRTDGRRSSWGSGCLMSWGSNADYALGNARRFGAIETAPRAVRSTPASAVSSISSGWASSCLLTDTRDPYCWGSSRYGQLGTSWYLNRPTSYLRGLSPSTTLAGALGTNSGCAITTNRELRCIGLNSSGQLGVGDLTNRSTLTPVTGVLAGESVAEVSVGESHACAVTTGGRVACWGVNIQGQVNRSQGSTVLSPVWVEGVLSGQSVTAISVGQTHSCALTSTGRVACWGGDYSGQLGNGSTYTSRSEPVWVTGVLDSASGTGETITQLEAGANHTCALTSAGRAACWGSNSDGQLGIGQSAGKNSPVWVGGALPTSGLDVISAGGASTCASGAELDTYCWGRGDKGQLGDAQKASRSRPQKAAGLLYGANASQIQVGGAFALAMWGGWATPGQLASAPRDLGVTVVGTTATLTWLTPRLSGGAEVIAYRVQQRASWSDPWVTVSTVATRSASVPLASDGFWQFRVVPVTDVGEGAASDFVEALRATGTRLVRENVPLTLTTSWGTPLSGTRISWSSRDGVFTSVVPVTTSSAGTVTVPQLVTGPVTFFLEGGSDALRGIQLGIAFVQEQIPSTGGVTLVPAGDRKKVTRSVTIRMPDGTPVPGASLTINGGITGVRRNVQDTGDRRVQVGWVVPGYSNTVTTDAFGRVTVTGFPKRSTSSDISATYSNGYLQQIRSFRLSSSTIATFEQMPVARILSVSSPTVTPGGTSVVTVRAVDENGSPLAGRTVSLETVTAGGGSVRVSVRSTCASNPSAVTDGTGTAQITVCPSSTAAWRAGGASIVPSTPVTITVTTPTPAPPPAPAPPPGPAPAPPPAPAPSASPSPSESGSPSPSPSASPSPSPGPVEPVPVPEPPAPGGAEVLVGGVPDPNFAMEAKPGSDNVQIEGTGYQLALASDSGDGVDERGALLLPQGGSLRLGGGGFAARNPVSAYIDPPTTATSSWTRLVARATGSTIYLGEVLTDDQGNLSGALEIPSSVAPGDRTLQLVGATSTGAQLVLVVGIAVAESTDQPSITITGSRGTGKNRLRVTVRGETTGLTGAVVRPWVKFPGQRAYVQGVARITVGPDGRFTWGRKAGKKTYVYFTTESGVKSGAVVIAAASRK